MSQVKSNRDFLFLRSNSAAFKTISHRYNASQMKKWRSCINWFILCSFARAGFEPLIFESVGWSWMWLFCFLASESSASTPGPSMSEAESCVASPSDSVETPSSADAELAEKKRLAAERRKKLLDQVSFRTFRGWTVFSLTIKMGEGCKLLRLVRFKLWKWKMKWSSIQDSLFISHQT